MRTLVKLICLEHLINVVPVVDCHVDMRRAEEQNSADLKKPTQAAAHIIALSKSSRGCFRSRRMRGVTGSLGWLDFGLIR